MQRTIITLGLLFCLLGSAVAEPVFPKLSGRIVDEVNLLSAAKRHELVNLLEQHEQASSNQVVIVIVKSLQGYSIEDYGYQLGRHWGIGQKELDNGVLLIVAPNERRVRIEVGYGLEGTLTDALSHNIIQSKILPAFRKNQYEQGIAAGTRAILQALQGTYTAVRKDKERFEPGVNLGKVIFAFLALLFVGDLLQRRLRQHLLVSGILMLITFVIAWLMTGVILIAIVFAVLMFVFYQFFTGGGGDGGSGTGSSGYWGGYYGGGGYSGGGFSGGGFSGGGGSFGGGGASGGW